MQRRSHRVSSGTDASRALRPPPYTPEGSASVYGPPTWPPASLLPRGRGRGRPVVSSPLTELSWVPTTSAPPLGVGGEAAGVGPPVPCHRLSAQPGGAS